MKCGECGAEIRTGTKFCTECGFNLEGDLSTMRHYDKQNGGSDKTIINAMFENIGGKIKKVAIVLCVIGIVLSVIIAICMFGMAIDSHGEMSIYGFLLLIIGPIASWLGSLPMYGFGELIEKVSDIRNCFSKTNISKDTINAVVRETFDELPEL